MKRVLCFVLMVALLCSQTIAGFCADNAAKVYLNGKLLTLKTPAETKDGTIMIPFSELMNRMGVFVSYDENEKSFSGTIDGKNIKALTESKVGYFDEVPIEMSTESVEKNRDILMPFDFYEKIYNVGIREQNGSVFISYIKKQTASVKGDEKVIDLEAELAKLPEGKVVIGEKEFLESGVYSDEITSKKIVEVDDGIGFDKAIELENITIPTKYYDSQVTQRNPSEIHEGEVLVLTFYARILETRDESGFGHMNVVFERMNTWEKYIDEDQELTAEWKKFIYPFIVSNPVAINGAQLGFRMGHHRQTVQVGGVELVNYEYEANLSDLKVVKKHEDQTTYYGREEDALWRQEALKRIEKERVRDILVKAVDGNGNPLENAEVSVNMTRSEFLWGSMMNSALFDADAVYNRQYRNNFKYNFNATVIESAMKHTYDGAFSNDEAVYLTNFAIENNLYFRCHAILWDELTLIVNSEEQGVPDMTEAEAREWIDRYVSRTMSSYPVGLTQIDVYNESVNNGYLRDKFGYDFVADLFRMTRKMNSTAKLYMNENGIRGQEENWPHIYKFEEIMQNLIAEGAPIDGIGVQSHMGEFIYPQDFYNQLDYLSKYANEMCITEYDWISKDGAIKNPELREQIEGDFMRDCMLVAYSHPKMTGFVMWGFSDQNHWAGDGPLLYRNMQAKDTAYRHWRNYVWDEWFTQESGKTDANGEFNVRGHRGEYDVTIKYNGVTAKTSLKVEKDGENTVSVVFDGKTAETTSSKPVPEPPSHKYYKRNMIADFENLEEKYLETYENRASEAFSQDGTDKSFLLDESNTQFWSSDKNNSYVEIRTDDVKKFGVVNIDWFGDRFYSYKVLISEDGENWEELKSGTGSKLSEIYFDENTRYVRVVKNTLSDIAIKGVSITDERIKRYE